MDGREAMASFFMQRGMGGSSSGTQAGFHVPTSIRPLSNPSIIQSNIGGNSVGSTFHVDNSVSSQSMNVGGLTSGETVKRKRGRPRKYGPDGTVSLALSPRSSAPAHRASTPTTTPGSLTPTTQKRGRGRPPGSGRKQQLASLGEWLSGSAGMGFTPHIITIPVGEDIVTKIMSFSQQGPRAVCILSANGAVSTVTLRQPATSGGTVTYEGRFEILCLSGSYLLTDNGESCSRTGGLSVSLSSPDGRVIGGGVGGMLIAASPVQVIVGSFIYGGTKTKNKSGSGPEPNAESKHPTGDKSATSISAPPNQNLHSSIMGGLWPGSRPMDMRNAHMDIDLTRG
ncbi:AT-hook motif nuclear-localized protein 11-like [Tasmannia lanceolata]|uniref:AT-hook motif nuclear-localized protein 11-like n=1 Tax=Tasmannia lanceolata TaxID=3420 RepID=UPI004063B611